MATASRPARARPRARPAGVDRHLGRLRAWTTSPSSSARLTRLRRDCRYRRRDASADLVPEPWFTPETSLIARAATPTILAGRERTGGCGSSIKPTRGESRGVPLCAVHRDIAGKPPRIPFSWTDASPRPPSRPPGPRTIHEPRRPPARLRRASRSRRGSSSRV
jgi:hypothetical protein